MTQAKQEGTFDSATEWNQANLENLEVILKDFDSETGMQLLECAHPGLYVLIMNHLGKSIDAFTTAAYDLH